MLELLEQFHNLDDASYLEANGIDPSEVDAIRAEVEAQIDRIKEEETIPFINSILKKRQEEMIFLTGVEAEIKRLTELKKRSEKKIERIEGFIDHLMNLNELTTLNTEFNKLSYRKSEAVIFTNESEIPLDFCEEIVTKKISKDSIKKAIKSGEQVPGAILEERFNLLIK